MKEHCIVLGKQVIITKSWICTFSSANNIPTKTHGIPSILFCSVLFCSFFEAYHFITFFFYFQYLCAVTVTQTKFSVAVRNAYNVFFCKVQMSVRNFDFFWIPNNNGTRSITWKAFWSNTKALTKNNIKRRRISIVYAKRVWKIWHMQWQL